MSDYCDGRHPLYIGITFQQIAYFAEQVETSLLILSIGQNAL